MSGFDDEFRPVEVSTSTLKSIAESEFAMFPAATVPPMTAEEEERLLVQFGYDDGKPTEAEYLEYLRGDTLSFL